jgi:hypothetical protein
LTIKQKLSNPKLLKRGTPGFKPVLHKKEASRQLTVLIRPFQVNVSEAERAELRRRINATRRVNCEAVEIGALRTYDRP